MCTNLSFLVEHNSVISLMVFLAYVFPFIGFEGWIIKHSITAIKKTYKEYGFSPVTIFYSTGLWLFAFVLGYLMYSIFTSYFMKPCS